MIMITRLVMIAFFSESNFLIRAIDNKTAGMHREMIIGLINEAGGKAPGRRENSVIIGYTENKYGW